MKYTDWISKVVSALDESGHDADGLLLQESVSSDLKDLYQANFDPETAASVVAEDELEKEEEQETLDEFEKEETEAGEGEEEAEESEETDTDEGESIEEVGESMEETDDDDDNEEEETDDDDDEEGSMLGDMNLEDNDEEELSEGEMMFTEPEESEKEVADSDKEGTIEVTDDPEGEASEESNEDESVSADDQSVDDLLGLTDDQEGEVKEEEEESEEDSGSDESDKDEGGEGEDAGESGGEELMDEEFSEVEEEDVEKEPEESDMSGEETIEADPEGESIEEVKEDDKEEGESIEEVGEGEETETEQEASPEEGEELVVVEDEAGEADDSDESLMEDDSEEEEKDEMASAYENDDYVCTLNADDEWLRQDLDEYDIVTVGSSNILFKQDMPIARYNAEVWEETPIADQKQAFVKKIAEEGLVGALELMDAEAFGFQDFQSMQVQSITRKIEADAGEYLESMQDKIFENVMDALQTAQVGMTFNLFDNNENPLKYYFKEQLMSMGVLPEDSIKIVQQIFEQTCDEQVEYVEARTKEMLDHSPEEYKAKKKVFNDIRQTKSRQSFSDELSA